MALYGSCGHQCVETVSVRYRAETCTVEGFQPCIIYAEFCPDCAETARHWPDFIRPEDWDSLAP